LGAEIAGACIQLWSAVGLTAEARNWVSSALERVDVDARPLVAAPLWLAHSTLATSERSYEMAVRALRVFEQNQDEAGTADALTQIAWQNTEAGRKDDAEAAVARALEIYSRSGPELLLARCISMQAIIVQHREDFDTACALFRDALARFRALGDERRVGGVLTNLGGTAFLAGDLQEAQRCFVEALEILSRRKNAVDLAILRGNIAMNLIALDDISGARETARAAMNNAIATHDEKYVADIALYLACVAARTDRMAEAARLYGYSRQQYESAGLPHKIRVFQPGMWLTKWLADGLEAPDLVRLTSEGAGWPEKHAIEEALKL
jgi:tetratricopeptide (TPR) repeat protein